jgi:hypothetical protein
MKSFPLNDEIFKMVQIGEDTYRIQKFTARDGLKLARMVLAKIAPIIPLLKDMKTDGEDDGEDNFDYNAVSVALDGLNDQDMDYLMNKCLRVCCKMLPAGPQAVIDENGNYGIPEAEYDMGLTVRLVVEAIRWGASDFFGGKGLDLKALFNRDGK